MKFGARVGAMLQADADTVDFLGYGVLKEMAIPDENVGGLGALCRMASIPNPKIVLDSGQVVWGCECWWGSEKEVQKRLAQAKEVRLVDINDIRKECSK